MYFSLDVVLLYIVNSRRTGIILADRLNGSCKRTFLKPSLRVEKFENAALVLSFGQQIHILCLSMTPTPHPSASSLQPLNPATPHNNNNNNNNNGRLHDSVCAANILGLTRLVVEYESQKQFDLIIGSHK